VIYADTGNGSGRISPATSHTATLGTIAALLNAGRKSSEFGGEELRRMKIECIKANSIFASSERKP
jgi:hypothetical protein